MEDKKVADRLLEIWPNIVKIVDFWQSLPKSKRPSSKSFENVLKAVKDPLTTVKLSFFSFLASLFKPFLLKYQTRKPMIPYFYHDLVSMFRSVLQLVVKEDVLQKCASGQDLLKIDLDNKETFKKKKEFHLGFSTESLLKDLKRKDMVKSSEVSNFLTNVWKCVVETMKKMFERCPLGSIVVRNAVVFNPRTISSSISSSNETTLLKKFKLLLKHLIGLKIMAAHKADKALQQYSDFLTHFKQASVDIEDIIRLDDFYFKEFKISDLFPELSSVIKIILTMSHGQADVE